ncbi:GNAT family N-acetyltransferase [Streptomyces sp. NPDC001604]|uniref:GNAT family N-acetyltransferase n=1 Tax=Streptomyces sp. NPDC001604 TaxID=3364593 RepID=UPI0036C45217
MFVPPAARGHGLGAALMARAVGEARSPGLHPVLDVVEQRWAPEQVVSLRRHAAPGQP